MVKQQLKYGAKGYWETAKTYQFKTSSDSTLQVFAHSPRGAKLKASNWERWLVKTRVFNCWLDTTSKHYKSLLKTINITFL